MTTTSIKSYDKNGLRTLVEQLGQPAYRARQLAEWLYGPAALGSEVALGLTDNLAGSAGGGFGGSFGGGLVGGFTDSAAVLAGAPITCFEQMTDLPRSLRERLTECCSLDAPKVLRRQDSRDGCRKYLIQLAGGTAVEAVALPAAGGRLTVCFSSQAGCGMGCVFCATGRAGLSRSLGSGEMVDQLLVVARDFAADPPRAARGASHGASRVTNAVAMGQGEPFANYDAVLGALRLINDDRLLGIGARHLTVSTCGLLDNIHRFAEEPEQFTLAVSLHSAVQETRDRLMPGMINQPLSVLLEELTYYATVSGRRPSLEYAMIAGVNDSAAELEALIGFARGRGALNFHVNLLFYNATGEERLRPTSSERAQEFLEGLSRAGVDANIRASRGNDIQGACGQLAGARGAG